MSVWDSDYVSMSMWDTLQTLSETVALVKFTNTVTVADECLAETVTMWDTWQTLSETVALVKFTNTISGRWMSGWDSDYVSMWDTLQTLSETVALVKFTNTVTLTQ